LLWKGALAIGASTATVVAIAASTVMSDHPNYVLCSQPYFMVGNREHSLGDHSYYPFQTCSEPCLK
jgi:hypothetical protein